MLPSLRRRQHRRDAARQLIGWNGTAQQIPLQGIATQAGQQFLLLGGFDAFGHDVQAKRLAQGDDGGHDGFVVIALGQLGHETPVDLQLVGR